jgi:hypothetical protein
VAGAVISSDSARKASNAQRDAANQANDTQLQMYNQTREDQTPYREAGYDALSQIRQLLGSPEGITKQPGYQFGMDQGTRALNSGAAARGMTYSGAAGKALTRYGQDYAGTKLDQSYNRLANIAGLGQVGSANNMNYGNQVSQNQLGVGNARAGSSLYQGNAWQNTGNQLAAAYNRYGSGGGGGDSWGSPGLNQFYYGNGTSGD